MPSEDALKIGLLEAWQCRSRTRAPCPLPTLPRFAEEGCIQSCRRAQIGIAPRHAMPPPRSGGGGARSATEGARRSSHQPHRWMIQRQSDSVRWTPCQARNPHRGPGISSSGERWEALKRKGSPCPAALVREFRAPIRKATLVVSPTTVGMPTLRSLGHFASSRLCVPTFPMPMTVGLFFISVSRKPLIAVRKSSGLCFSAKQPNTKIPEPVAKSIHQT